MDLRVGVPDEKASLESEDFFSYSLFLGYQGWREKLPTFIGSFGWEGVHCQRL
jgi:hypothetical protein